MAVNFTLVEYDTLCNYILRHDYKPDNAIERLQRYISLISRNFLFCRSYAGAERTALIYSLACSCRLNRINTFEYFTDILNRQAYISPMLLMKFSRSYYPTVGLNNSPINRTKEKEKT